MVLVLEPRRGRVGGDCFTWFFLVCDGGMRLWECTVLFNRYYAHSTNFGLAAFNQRIGEFWGDWWILFILPWAVLLRPVARLWFWLGIFIAALVATGAISYGHYYSFSY